MLFSIKHQIFTQYITQQKNIVSQQNVLKIQKVVLSLYQETTLFPKK
mgnify:CR=1 FL=1